MSLTIRLLYVWETLLRISCVELRERLQEPGGTKREVHRLPRDFPSFEELLIATKTTILSNLKLRQTSPWDTRVPSKEGRGAATSGPSPCTSWTLCKLRALHVPPVLFLTIVLLCGEVPLICQCRLYCGAGLACGCKHSYFKQLGVQRKKQCRRAHVVLEARVLGVAPGQHH